MATKNLRWKAGKRGLYSAVQAHRALWWMLVKNADNMEHGYTKAGAVRQLGLCLIHDCAFCQYAATVSGCREASGFCRMCPGSWGVHNGEKYYCANATNSWYWNWENMESADDVEEAAFMVLNTPMAKWNYGQWSW